MKSSIKIIIIALILLVGYLSITIININSMEKDNSTKMDSITIDSLSSEIYSRGEEIKRLKGKNDSFAVKVHGLTTSIEKQKSKINEMTATLRKLRVHNDKTVKDYLLNATDTGCVDVITSQSEVINMQADLIDSITCLTKHKDSLLSINRSVILVSGTIIQKQDSTISSLKLENELLDSRYNKIINKINEDKPLKRNAKWFVGSYRKWLKK